MTTTIISKWQPALAAKERIHSYVKSRYDRYSQLVANRKTLAEGHFERDTQKIKLENVYLRLCQISIRVISTLNLIDERSFGVESNDPHLAAHFALRSAVNAEMTTQLSRRLEQLKKYESNAVASVKDIMTEAMNSFSPLLPNFDMVPVADFMSAAGQTVVTTPTVPDQATANLRAVLALEEVAEQIDGLGVSIILSDAKVPGAPGQDSNIVDLATCKVTAQAKQAYKSQSAFDWREVIDGLCDCDVIRDGTILSLGLSAYMLRLCRVLVDISNLDKFDEGSYRRDDGKWVKQPTWLMPPIADVMIMFGFPEKIEAPDASVLPYIAYPMESTTNE